MFCAILLSKNLMIIVYDNRYVKNATAKVYFWRKKAAAQAAANEILLILSDYIYSNFLSEISITPSF